MVSILDEQAREIEKKVFFFGCYPPWLKNGIYYLCCYKYQHRNKSLFPVSTNAAFCKSSVVLFTSTMVDLLYWITWSVRMLKPYNILTLPYSTSLSGLRLHHLTSLTNQNFWLPTLAKERYLLSMLLQISA